jgi:hypothetical protein
VKTDDNIFAQSGHTGPTAAAGLSPEGDCEVDEVVRLVADGDHPRVRGRDLESIL